MRSISENDILQQLEKMNDREGPVRRDAILSLIGVKDPRVLYPFIKALQDEDQGIQQAAMDALTAFEDEVAVYNVLPLLSDRRVHVRNMAREILEKIGYYGVGLFSHYIKDKDEDVRKIVADILGVIKRPEAIKLLDEMLKDPCSNVRSAVADGLGRIGDSSVVGSLIYLLGDEEWVAFFAAGALGRIGDKRAVRHLVRLIGSSNVDLQVVAIEALGEIGGEEAVDSLTDAFDTLRPEATHTAVKALVRLTHGSVKKVVEKFGSERTFDYLRGALEEVGGDEPGIKRDFIRAFSVIDDPGSSACVLKLISGADTEDIEILQTATDALSRLGDENTLIEGLRDKNNTSVLIAVRVLGLLKSIRSVPRLIDLFDGVERDLKVEILLALGRIESRDSLEFLTDMLSHEEGHVRGAAAHGLGMMAASESAGPLLNRLGQEDYHNVVEEIVSALVKIGERHNTPSLFEGLVSNLSSKRPHVREIVIKGLGRLGYVKAAEYMKGMLSDENWRVRRACLEMLSHLNAPGLPGALITAASDEKEEVRMVVAQLAARYPEERAVDILISLLSDRNNRIICEAIEGLVKLNAARSIPYLLELIHQKEPSIQKAAIWGLGALNATEAGEILKNILYNEDTEIRDAAIEAYKKLSFMNNVIV